MNPFFSRDPILITYEYAYLTFYSPDPYWAKKVIFGFWKFSSRIVNIIQMGFRFTTKEVQIHLCGFIHIWNMSFGNWKKSLWNIKKMNIFSRRTIEISLVEFFFRGFGDINFVRIKNLFKPISVINWTNSWPIWTHTCEDWKWSAKENFWKNFHYIELLLLLRWTRASFPFSREHQSWPRRQRRLAYQFHP